MMSMTDNYYAYLICAINHRNDIIFRDKNNFL